MHRPMGGGVSEVKKERFFSIALFMVFKKPDCVITDRIGVIISLRLIIGVIDRSDVSVLPAQSGRVVKTAGSGNGSVKPVESALAGPVILWALGTGVFCNMPLSRHVILITSQSQSLCDSQNISAQLTLVPGQFLIPRHQSNSGLVLVETRQQRCPGWTASGGVVKLGKTQTVFRKGVKVRGLNLAPVATNIRITHIIGKDDHNIRLGYGINPAKHE